MLIDILRNRRSIRRYENRPVEQEKIDILIEAALRSPSSRGFNPWEFIVVTDPERLSKLSESKPHGASFIRNAPLGIVVLADPGKSDVWVEDASIASIILHLTAESLGLGSCWIQIRKRMYNDQTESQAYIRDLLKIPDHFAVESMIAIGYPAEKKTPHDRQTLDYGKIFTNRYK